MRKPTEKVLTLATGRVLKPTTPLTLRDLPEVLARLPELSGSPQLPPLPATAEPAPPQARRNPFGHVLKLARKKMNLTLEDTARRLKTHKGYVSGWECGTVNPPAHGLVRKAAKLFNLDPHRLYLLAFFQKAHSSARDELLRMFATVYGDPLVPATLALGLRHSKGSPPPRDGRSSAYSRERVLAALERADFNVARAARRLRVTPAWCRQLARRFGIPVGRRALAAKRS